MKKLVLFAVAVVAISFASCGNKANTDAAANADTTVVVEEVTEVVTDSVAPAATDSVAAEVPAAE